MKPKELNHVDAHGAELIALQALAFIASDPGQLGQFIAQTGISLDDLHHRAGDREVLAGVLGALLRDESALLMFCANNAIAPQDVPIAAHVLAQGTDR